MMIFKDLIYNGQFITILDDNGQFITYLNSNPIKIYLVTNVENNEVFDFSLLKTINVDSDSNISILYENIIKLALGN